MRVPIKRIAVTVPPAAWFHGIAWRIFEIYLRALADLGLTVFEVPVDAFLPPDAVRVADLVRELRAFRPELAFGLPLGSYALVCRLPARRDGCRPNLFTDVLDIPTVCLWDHAPLELADQLLTPQPNGPAGSTPGAIEALRSVLTHPRLVHWSRDSGQTEIMKDLGFALPNRVIQEPSPGLPGFGPQDTWPRREIADPRIAFVGHFYQDAPLHPDHRLAELEAHTIATWVDACDQPIWSLLAQETARLSAPLRRELALDPDQTHYWHFAHRLCIHRAQTALRLKLLGAVKAPVACYGNLRTGAAGVPENLRPFAGGIPFGPALAAVLARHEITVDVLNPGFIHGYSHKPLLGFASGGFVLLNRKRDFVDSFGDAGEAVSFRNGEELAAKADRFLGDRRFRCEVGESIRDTVAARFQLGDVLTRVLHAAVQRAGSESAAPKADGGVYPEAVVEWAAVASLLRLVRTKPGFPGATVHRIESGILLSTPAQAWAYAAEIRMPGKAKRLTEPHLRLRILVVTGRIGIGLLEDSGTLAAEQFASAGSYPVAVTVELPRGRPGTVILRNTVEGVSCALVLEASLCDRSGQAKPAQESDKGDH